MKYKQHALSSLLHLMDKRHALTSTFVTVYRHEAHVTKTRQLYSSHQINMITHSLPMQSMLHVLVHSCLLTFVHAFTATSGVQLV